MTYVIRDGNCNNLFGWECEIDESFTAPTDLIITRDGKEKEVNVDEILLHTDKRIVLKNSNFTMYLKRK